MLTSSNMLNLFSHTIWESIALSNFNIHYIQTGKSKQRVPSELKEVDETLWRNGNAAALWIVGCAGMVCIL